MARNRISWLLWLIVFAVLLITTVVATWLLSRENMLTLARIVFRVGSVLVNLWVYWGLWNWREVKWVRGMAVLVISADLAYLSAQVLWRVGFPGTAIAVVGIWAMAALFYIGLAAIRLLLSPGYPMFSVARTLVDEAIRMKVALVLLVALAMLVPIMPLMLQGEQLLRYRLQTFLSYSLMGLSLLLSLMTIFVGCGSICWEVSERQIYLTMTKPLSRGRYLFGKWLGLLLLNLLLLSVSGLGVYVFARALALMPAADAIDSDAVHNQVLVARVSTRVETPLGMDLGKLVEERIAQVTREKSVVLGPEITPTDRDAIRDEIIRKWHTIPPLGGQTFRFTGLMSARESQRNLQLRMKASSSKSTPNSRIRLAIWVNGQPLYAPDGVMLPIDLNEEGVSVIPVPWFFIDDQGAIDVRIENRDILDEKATFPASVTFDPGDGMEVLFTVGGFEGNFVRALAILWVRLSFLAMLALAAGTFLGFPVACLLSLMVYAIAVMSGFLTESLTYYVAFEDKPATMFDVVMGPPKLFFSQLLHGELWGAIKVLVRLLGGAAVWLVPSFSTYNPVPLLHDGKLVSYSLLMRALLHVGLVWTGLCGLVGWLIFRRRELARVTV